MFKECSPAKRQPVVLIQVEEKVIMANQEQNPCNRQQFEGDEPQLGAPAQPSPSLPPPPPRTYVLKIHGLVRIGSDGPYNS